MKEKLIDHEENRHDYVKGVIRRVNKSDRNKRIWWKETHQYRPEDEEKIAVRRLIGERIHQEKRRIFGINNWRIESVCHSFHLISVLNSTNNFAEKAIGRLSLSSSFIVRSKSDRSSKGFFRNHCWNWSGINLFRSQTRLKTERHHLRLTSLSWRVHTTTQNDQSNSRYDPLWCRPQAYLDKECSLWCRCCAYRCVLTSVSFPIYSQKETTSDWRMTVKSAHSDKEATQLGLIACGQSIDQFICLWVALFEI